MRLIDANALIREECGSCDGHCNTFDGEECLKCTSHNKCQLREALDSAHTVDAVEVVRCVDCERGEPSLIRKGEILCDWWRCHTRCDGFCHMGVEKTEIIARTTAVGLEWISRTQTNGIHARKTEGNRMHKCDTCKWVRAYTDELFQTRPICFKASTIAEGIRAYNAKECPFVKKVVKQDAERND